MFHKGGALTQIVDLPGAAMLPIPFVESSLRRPAAQALPGTPRRQFKQDMGCLRQRSSNRSRKAASQGCLQMFSVYAGVCLHCSYDPSSLHHPFCRLCLTDTCPMRVECCFRSALKAHVADGTAALPMRLILPLRVFTCLPFILKAQFALNLSDASKGSVQNNKMQSCLIMTCSKASLLWYRAMQAQVSPVESCRVDPVCHALHLHPGFVNCAHSTQPAQKGCKAEFGLEP